MIGDDVLAQADSGSASYMLHDGHGSTRQMADHTGAVASWYNYDAYGNVQSGTSSSSAEDAVNNNITSHLYCGEQYDSALQMYNLRARYYNPSNGRFSQRDTFKGINQDPESLHKYMYASCDPTNNIDPSGYLDLVDLLVTAGIVGILSGIVAGTVSKILGGSFAEGFFKGLITGSLTTILSLWLGPVLAGAVANTIAQTVITEWYINGFQNPKESLIRIGVSALLGAFMGFVGKLPKMDNLQVEWFVLLKNVDVQGLKKSVDLLVNEGLKFFVSRSFSSAISGATNTIIKFVFGVVNFGESLQQKQIRQIKSALLTTFGTDIPNLTDESDLSAV